ncbi:MAG TPA: family 10 glycosylhydrolase [Candidatus Obscuribacterales bacterium]
MVQRRSQTFFQQVILGTLASTILQLSIPLTSLSQINTSLGVIREPEQTTEWNSIEQRLKASRIPYQTLDLNNIKSPADLQGIRILFLPNITVIKTEQAKVLQEWAKQGGQVIASGPIAEKSTPLVRQLLRSILGSYWAFPLTVPAKPQIAKNRCRTKDPICASLTTWGPIQTNSNAVEGGVLIPTTLESYTAGIWEASGSSPAVITTQKATYLGWRWGNQSSPDVDIAWLQAAVSRHGLAENPTTTPIATATVPPPTAPRPTPPTPTTATRPAPTMPTTATRPASIPLPVPQPQPTTLRVQPTATVPAPRPVTPTLVPQAPISPPRSTTPPAPSVTATRTLPNTPAVPSRFIDPSEQTAPAGLEVTPGNQPIEELTAIAMRQELINLLGRFENALIASNSGNIPINLQVASTQLIAGTGGNLASANFKKSDQIITKARELIKNFPQLVAQQNWTEARQQWLETRQQLWQHYPIEGERLGAEIRAVWLDRGTIVKARNEAGLAQVFDRLAAAGINTVYFETINAGYPIYPSRIAPAQNPLTQGWNPLEAAVKLAHQRGMELHAWIWVFAVGNDRHNQLLGQPSSFLSPVIQAHPDWININNYGELRNPRDRKVYLDPANREARAYLMRLINEITAYNVDGLQLDYIRYPFQDPSGSYTYGYGKAGREQFQQLTGVDPVNITPKNNQLWNQWLQFKTQQVTSFVAEVSQFLQQQKPNVILSVAVFSNPEQERIMKIQQQWEVWAKNGYVDLIVPMTYAMDTNRLQRITQPLTQEQRLGSALISPSIKLLNLPEIVAIDQLQSLRDLPTGGYSIFAVESIGNNLHNHFYRTQNYSAQTQPPIPYRKPFAAARDRYLALKREWSFLLANDQLWIRDEELKSLSIQAEELAQTLKQLEDNPSLQTLGIAQQKLATFQKQFQTSMRLQALERPYQVSSWGNRLASINMLLRYGERRIKN